MRRPGAEQWDAGYVRVSTEMQVERDALRNQIQALEAYAVAHGLVLRVYKDEGISAKDTDRPDLQRLLADVRTGRVRTVLVTKLDRISRSLADLLDLVKLFEQHGVKFVSLRDNIDTAGPVGRFMLHLLGAIAELERGITAERVAEDMKLRAKRGKWNGGLAPYGRRVEDGQLKIVPEEAAVLRRMRDLLLQKRTWLGVVYALNREGARTRGWDPLEHDGRIVRKGHAPSEWTPPSVKRVLLQPINAGTLVYNRCTVKGKTSVPRPADEHVVVADFCEPIFSREEMDELRRVAAEIEGTPPREAVSPHLLSGLVECACGTKMYGINSYVATKRGRYRADLQRGHGRRGGAAVLPGGGAGAGAAAHGDAAAPPVGALLPPGTEAGADDRRPAGCQLVNGSGGGHASVKGRGSGSGSRHWLSKWPHSSTRSASYTR